MSQNPNLLGAQALKTSKLINRLFKLEFWQRKQKFLQRKKTYMLLCTTDTTGTVLSRKVILVCHTFFDTFLKTIWWLQSQLDNNTRTMRTTNVKFHVHKSTSHSPRILTDLMKHLSHQNVCKYMSIHCKKLIFLKGYFLELARPFMLSYCVLD